MRVRQALVAICLIAGLAACEQPDPSSTRDAAGTATNVGPSSTLSEETADHLSRRYIQCVNAAGFKIQFVQVFDLPDTGIMVKTEVDVPAPVHAPCFKSIGGPSTDRSSWGL